MERGGTIALVALELKLKSYRNRQDAHNENRTKCDEQDYSPPEIRRERRLL